MKLTLTHLATFALSLLVGACQSSSSGPGVSPAPAADSGVTEASALDAPGDVESSDAATTTDAPLDSSSACPRLGTAACTSPNASFTTLAQATEQACTQFAAGPHLGVPGVCVQPCGGVTAVVQATGADSWDVWMFDSSKQLVEVAHDVNGALECECSLSGMGLDPSCALPSEGTPCSMNPCGAADASGDVATE